jgi:DNA-binding NarL/FixJ family response regulator
MTTVALGGSVVWFTDEGLPQSVDHDQQRHLMGNRKLTVIYVENDPLLRSLIANLLRANGSIANVHEFDSGEPAITFAENNQADVALIDFALGANVMDGIAVGTQLQRLIPNMGIVVHTQHSLTSLDTIARLNKRVAWSFFQKRADNNIDQLVGVLKSTSSGISQILGDEQDRANSGEMTTNIVLSQRQHLVLSMLATGVEPKSIAQKLNISFESVRKELSNAYSALVPNPEPGMDLRVTSILRYQQLNLHIQNA